MPPVSDENLFKILPAKPRYAYYKPQLLLNAFHCFASSSLIFSSQYPDDPIQLYSSSPFGVVSKNLHGALLTALNIMSWRTMDELDDIRKKAAARSRENIRIKTISKI